MTRDQWLAQAAQQLMAHGGMDLGSATAYAEEMIAWQRQDNGRNPAHWDAPGDAAEREVKLWAI